MCATASCPIALATTGQLSSPATRLGKHGDRVSRRRNGRLGLYYYGTMHYGAPG